MQLFTVDLFFFSFFLFCSRDTTALCKGVWRLRGGTGEPRTEETLPRGAAVELGTSRPARAAVASLTTAFVFKFLSFKSLDV